MSNILKRVQQQRAESAETATKEFETKLQNIIKAGERDLSTQRAGWSHLKGIAAEIVEDTEAALDHLVLRKRELLQELDQEILEYADQIERLKTTRRGWFAGMFACIPVAALICTGLVFSSDRKANASVNEIVSHAQSALRQNEVALLNVETELRSANRHLAEVRSIAQLFSGQTNGWHSGTTADGSVWLLPPTGTYIDRKRSRDGDPGYGTHKFYWQTEPLR